MAKTIPVIFGGDNSIRNEQRIAYTNFVNEVLADLKNEILADTGFLKVICKNRLILNPTYESDDMALKKKVESKLSGSSFKY